MNIPEVRYAGHRGDGVDVLHCLHCDGYIPLQLCLSREDGYGKIEFCSFCGTRWERGRVTDNRRRELRNRCWRRDDAPDPWVLEWRDPQWGPEWHKVRTLNGSALQVFKTLQQERGFRGDDEELRVQPNQRSSPQG